MVVHRRQVQRGLLGLIRHGHCLAVLLDDLAADSEERITKYILNWTLLLYKSAKEGNRHIMLSDCPKVGSTQNRNNCCQSTGSPFEPSPRRLVQRRVVVSPLQTDIWKK